MGGQGTSLGMESADEVVRLTDAAPTITLQPFSRTGNSGGSITLTVVAEGTPPLEYQWWKDGITLPGETEPLLTLTTLQELDAGDYIVIIRNDYGTATSLIARLFVNYATVDADFNPGAEGPLRPSVSALVVQPDGKVLVGGGFTHLGGHERNNLGRLNPDGTLDEEFNPEVGGAGVSVLALQPDGRIVVAGSFTSLAGQHQNRIKRLNADGALDEAFNLEVDGWVNCLAVQADGRILAGGHFTALGGLERHSIARLNPDGTVDSHFNPVVGPSRFIFQRTAQGPGAIHSLALQPDGKILLAGDFGDLDGHTRLGIGRLNPDGSVDEDFNPRANGPVHSLAVQPDGQILAVGSFLSLGGATRFRIARLNSNGTADPAFYPAANERVDFVAVQADGRILVTGRFHLLQGTDQELQFRRHIGRLHPDGTFDHRFAPAVGPEFQDHTTFNSTIISSMAVQPDGKLLIGGMFNEVAGEPRRNIARINNTAPALDRLTLEDATLAWQRGGSAPEVWRTTFEYSSDDEHWTLLGEGTRTDEGWELRRVFIPSPGTVRARGHVTGRSNWFVETTIAVLPSFGFWRDELGFIDGRFGFRFNAPPGEIVIIEASSDLKHWTPIRTNSFGEKPLYWSDPESGTRPMRFYRLRH